MAKWQTRQHEVLVSFGTSRFKSGWGYSWIKLVLNMVRTGRRACFTPP